MVWVRLDRWGAGRISTLEIEALARRLLELLVRDSLESVTSLAERAYAMDRLRRHLVALSAWRHEHYSVEMKLERDDLLVFMHARGAGILSPSRAWNTADELSDSTFGGLVSR